MLTHAQVVKEALHEGRGRDAGQEQIHVGGSCYNLVLWILTNKIKTKQHQNWMAKSVQHLHYELRQVCGNTMRVSLFE